MPLADSFANPSFANFLIAVVIDAGLATLIFRHAHRRGNRHATAWGVFTFLAAALAIPLYFANYWLRRERR
jgi:dolichol kinase